MDKADDGWFDLSDPLDWERWVDSIDPDEEPKPLSAYSGRERLKRHPVADRPLQPNG